MSALDDNGVIAFAPFLVQTDWPQFHFSPVHAGVNPYEFTLSTSTVGSLNNAWVVNQNFFGTAPVVAGETIYVGLQPAAISALDPKTGGTLWTFPDPVSNCATSGLAAYGGTIFFGDTGLTDNCSNLNTPAHIVAVTASGALLWTFQTSSQANWAPTVANGIVYATTLDGTLYAIKATTGSLVWSNAGCCYESPAFANGVVYVGGGSSVYALNGTTGKVKWTAPVPGGTGVSSSMALANGAVYFGTVGGGGQLVALSQTNGSLLWTYNAGNAGFSTPAATKSKVYFSCVASLCAVDAKTGVLDWSFPTSGTPPMTTSPVVADGVVYFNSNDGNIYAVNAATGAYLWSYPIGSPQVVSGDDSAVVVESSVYILSDGCGFNPCVWAFR